MQIIVMGTIQILVQVSVSAIARTLIISTVIFIIMLPTIQVTILITLDTTSEQGWV